MPHIGIKLLLLALVLLLFLPPLSGCAPARDLDDQIWNASNPYRFHLFRWEVEYISGEALNTFNRRQTDTDNATSREKLVEKRIQEAYAAEGIYNPLDRFINLKASFPPVNIYLAKPPHLLVVSPRDRIQSIRAITLLPDMEIKDMEDLEARIDNLGYSSLVVDLGGLATFPAYVSQDADTQYILKTAAEEWLHQYLAFTPLGFLYLLDTTGIRLDYDIATMNETVVNLVSREIGDIVYRQYYAPPPTAANAPKTAASGFDFNRTMRETRLTVDNLLARGEIEAAEKFMAGQREYMAAHGHYIRKLNQAYFAFHGTYADSPTSVSPIGVDIKNLRSESASLKDFLDKASAITSLQDLALSVR